MGRTSQKQLDAQVPLLVDAFFSSSGLEVYVVFGTNGLHREQYVSFQFAAWGCQWTAPESADPLLVQMASLPAEVVSDPPDQSLWSLPLDDEDSEEEVDGFDNHSLQLQRDPQNTSGVVGVVDKHRHSLVLKCGLPPKAVGISNLTVKVEPAGLPAYSYNAVPVSSSGLFEPSLIAMCTMMTQSAAVTPYLAQWVAYHLAYGFEQVVIYIEDPTTLWAEEALSDFIVDGHVRLVHFYFPPISDLHRNRFQQAQEQHCLYQAKGTVTWLAHADADEYFQLMQGRSMSTMRQFLEPYPPRGVVAIQVRSQFWFRSPGSTVSMVPCDLTCKKSGYFPQDFRTKLILSTKKVMYYSVHVVTASTAGQMVYADPDMQLRLNHFKMLLNNHGPNDFCFLDFSFREDCKSTLNKQNWSGLAKK